MGTMGGGTTWSASEEGKRRGMHIFKQEGKDDTFEKQEERMYGGGTSEEKCRKKYTEEKSIKLLGRG